MTSRALGRSQVWWPGFDQQVADYVAACATCQAHAPDPRRQVVDWPCPDAPWDRLHLDLFNLDNNDYLVLADANTKWMECAPMRGTP